MSLTQWLTRSSPMVSWRPAAKATFNFVPTPSLELTSTGCFQPDNKYPPPKLPISVRTCLVKVVRACLRISETARSASSMLTPASWYRTGLEDWGFWDCSIRLRNFHHKGSEREFRVVCVRRDYTELRGWRV